MQQIQSKFIKIILSSLISIIIIVISALLIIQFLTQGEEVMVPNLIGKEDREAYEILNRVGLYMKKIYKCHPRAPENYVVSQEPFAGLMVKANRRIKVYISKGPRIKIVPTLEKTPANQRFCSVVEAKNMLRRFNLNVGFIAQVHSPKVPQGYIIAQSPSPHSEIREEGKINLLVSKGARAFLFYLPDFVGKSMEETGKFIEKLGLVVKISEACYPNLKSGLILKQSPPGNSLIKEGGVISFVINTQNIEKKEESYYKVLRYTVPAGLLPKLVRIVVIDKKGRRKVYEKEENPGAALNILLFLTGKAKAEIYLGKELVKKEVFD